MSTLTKAVIDVLEHNREADLNNPATIERIATFIDRLYRVRIDQNIKELIVKAEKAINSRMANESIVN